MLYQKSCPLLFLGMAAFLGTGCQTGTSKINPASVAYLDTQYKHQFASAAHILSEGDLKTIFRPRSFGATVEGSWDGGLFVPSTYEGEQVELGVIPSSNTNAIAGVRHMRNGDWSLASQCFGRALEENPEDHLVLFADGVCYEKRGDDRLLVGATEHKLTRGRNVISNNRRAEQDVLTIALADYTEALKLYKQANYNQPSVQGDASIRRLSAKIMRTKERQGDRQ